MPARRVYVDTDRGQVHGVVAGDDGPWLVLHHESPLSWRVFDAALDPLAAYFRVLALDTPGYGASDALTPDAEIPEYAAMLLSAIRQVVGEDPFAVCGVHTGASIALEVGLQSSGQASHAVFLGLPAYDPQTRAERLATWAPPYELQPDGGHLMAVWHRYDAIWQDAPVELQHQAVVDVLGVLPRYGWGYNAAFRYDPLPGLRRLTPPILFLSAEGDPLTPADRSSAELVGARLVVLPGLPGQVPARAPEIFTRELVQFLQPT
jgi:haloalkane dehalogenase